MEGRDFSGPIFENMVIFWRRTRAVSW